MILSCRYVLLSFGVLLTACSHFNDNVVAEVQTAIVSSTGDGDALRVDQAGQTITLRLGCIDSLEIDQPGGQAAADRLRQLLPRDQQIQLIPNWMESWDLGAGFDDTYAIARRLVRNRLADLDPIQQSAIDRLWVEDIGPGSISQSQ